MRVLVFGSSGQVARELARARWAEGTALTFLDRQAANLSRPEMLGAIVRRHAPDAVIVAAGYTNVDAAESDERTAHAVNAGGPSVIAREAAELSAPVIYLSTDYVFDGQKDGLYDEKDPVYPLSAYGRSKLAGEAAIRVASPKHLILRTAWVYSAHGRNFLRAMLKRAEAGDDVRVVADQEGCPTSAADIAEAIARTLPALVTVDPPFGTYHLAGGTTTTWHGFAEAIFEELRSRGLWRPRNEPISTSDYPTPARRPLNSRLSSELFAKTFGVRLPGYETVLPAILDNALAESAAKPAISEAS